MPIVIVGVALWLTSLQSRAVEGESIRVRLLLIQLLEEVARDPQSQLQMQMLQGSDPILCEELRMRLRAEVTRMPSAVPLVDVRVGDFGVGSVGGATHTALASYLGAKAIAVRVIATPKDGRMQIVGVFTPSASDFAQVNADSTVTQRGRVELP